MDVEFPASFSGLTDRVCVRMANSYQPDVYEIVWRTSPSASSHYRVFYKLVGTTLRPFSSSYYTGNNGNSECESQYVLQEGDIVYKPELKVYFPVISFCIICFILLMIYRIFLKRLLP